MFGKESEMKPEEGKLSTIIARGTKIVGNINMEGSLRIDGHVNGKVSSTETLTVGKTGVVEGELSVKEAVVGGKIIGNLIAHQRVELENKAAILGDVKTRIFVIKEGGVLGSVYKMWYRGCNEGYENCAIGYATSPDGVNWTKPRGNPVLTGDPGEWDEGFLAYPAVIVNGSSYSDY